jgi:outer membrane cobalamin receptor
MWSSRRQRGKCRKSQVGASVTVLDARLLDALGNTDLLESLRAVPGVEVVQTGARGGLTSLFVRGGASNFNKVLIDGVPADDIGGAFDFSDLVATGVERIEVLRGSNSVRFGSDALSGVINITTRRARRVFRKRHSRSTAATSAPPAARSRSAAGLRASTTSPRSRTCRRTTTSRTTPTGIIRSPLAPASSSARPPV